MKIEIRLTTDRLEELLKAAYEDGFEDGFGEGTSDGCQFAESVTKDQFDVLVQRVRNGGKP